MMRKRAHSACAVSPVRLEVEGRVWEHNRAQSGNHILKILAKHFLADQAPPTRHRTLPVLKPVQWRDNSQYKLFTNDTWCSRDYLAPYGNIRLCEQPGLNISQCFIACDNTQTTHMIMVVSKRGPGVWLKKYLNNNWGPTLHFYEFWASVTALLQEDSLLKQEMPRLKFMTPLSGIAHPRMKRVPVRADLSVGSTT